MSRRSLRRPQPLTSNAPQAQPLALINLANSSLQLFNAMSQPSAYLPLALRNNIKQQYQKLVHFAAENRVVYMTDQQAFRACSLFVINKQAMPGVWSSTYYGNVRDFQMYINPKIEEKFGGVNTVEQQCFSFPFLKCMVERVQKIGVSYTKFNDLMGDPRDNTHSEVKEQITGFRAQIFQHCMDHLQGRTFATPEMSRGRIFGQMDNNFLPKTLLLIKEYNLRVKRALEEGKTNTEEFKKMRDDYLERIRKQYAPQLHDAKKMINSRTVR